MGRDAFGQQELPVYDDHAPLDDASAAVVASASGTQPAKWWTQDIETSRREYAEMVTMLGLPVSGLADRTMILIEAASDRMLPLHIYRPNDRAADCAILFMRGSGMCMGNMGLYHAILERLAHYSNALVVAPEYRLSPEHQYPAGHDDAYTAFEWMVGSAAALGVDPDNLVLAGDSAGGMLAVATAMRARKEHPKTFALQILVAPALGTRPESFSVLSYGDGYLLDTEDLAWLYRTYEGTGKSDDPMIYPIMAADLSDMPPTFMITAGSDIMRDDAEAFLKQLQRAGVAVELERFEGTVHPFLNMGGAIPACDRALRTIGSRVIDFFG